MTVPRNSKEWWKDAKEIAWRLDGIATKLRHAEGITSDRIGKIRLNQIGKMMEQLTYCLLQILRGKEPEYPPDRYEETMKAWKTWIEVLKKEES
ncbi:MAG: hypothetical protein DRO11_00115 [Methanobacteriota archaeon]|nr:MAG: hypothetical protein DRO11_00115 [Euryarchaeota archaeon]